MRPGRVRPGDDLRRHVAPDPVALAAMLPGRLRPEMWRCVCFIFSDIRFDVAGAASPGDSIGQWSAPVAYRLRCCRGGFAPEMGCG